MPEQRTKHRNRFEPLPERVRGGSCDRNRPLIDAERSWAMARFQCMRSPGGVEIGFSAMGSSVRAERPEELVEATHVMVVEATSTQQPS